jgi:hypothetical protein
VKQGIKATSLLAVGFQKYNGQRNYGFFGRFLLGEIATIIHFEKKAKKNLRS